MVALGINTLACYYRDLSGATARVLIAFGANVNDTRNGTSSSPLHLAVKELNTKVAQVLLEAGCDMNLLVKLTLFAV